MGIVVDGQGGNQFLAPDIVEGIWNEIMYQGFLKHVTFHPSPMQGKSSLTYVQPYYNRSVSSGDDANYTPSAYLSPFQTVTWQASNYRTVEQTLATYEETLFLTKQEVRVNFARSLMQRLSQAFEWDFADMLQSSFTNAANIWPVCLPMRPRMYSRFASGFSYEQLFNFWQNSAVALRTGNNTIPIGFLPQLSSLGGWALQTCSQRACYSGMLEPRLACSQSIAESITQDLSTNSANYNSLLTSKEQYDETGAINNGMLQAYTLPNLEPIYDSVGWAQGLIFKISSATLSNGVVTLILTLSTNIANRTTELQCSISRYVPLVLGVKRWTPRKATRSTALGANGELAEQWGTFNIINQIVTFDISSVTNITVTVRAEQLAGRNSKYPVLEYSGNITELAGQYVTTPWRMNDFYSMVSVSGAAFRCLSTGTVIWEQGYLYSKQAAHAFSVRPQDIGGGLSEKHEKQNNVPFLISEVSMPGGVAGGLYGVQASGLMPTATTPQLGHLFLATN